MALSKGRSVQKLNNLFKVSLYIFIYRKTLNKLYNYETPSEATTNDAHPPYMGVWLTQIEEVTGWAHGA